MENLEKIGKVTLDYKYYSGEDLYSDGVIEDELLKTVESYSEDELGKVINEKNEWVYLYHFSQVRRNIISWIPLKKEDKVLEIGAGCGAITGGLAEKVERVDCVELSRKRSLINANRNKEYDGITIKVGNFEEIEPHLDEDYDVITLIGVWEYAAVYLSSKDPFYDFLRLLKKHLKPDGKIIIAIENKYGLKYWAGCREDHTGMFFEGLEGYTSSNSAVTFGKKDLEHIFHEVGYQPQFYYPYPDYKLPLHIFSDDYLPKTGMLKDNHKNLDNTRMVLFDEDKVFDSVIQDGMFPYFSNSFLIILTQDGNDSLEDKVIYSKYSNERAEEFRIRTDIIKKAEGDLIVKKYPMHKKAETHIAKLYDLYEMLQKKCVDTPVCFNRCEKEGKAVSFEYISGKNLYEELKLLLLKGNKEEAENIIQQTVQIIKNMADDKFAETPEFNKIFGSCPLEGVPAVKGADIDLIFSNIICKDDQWNVIDYEWSYDFSIPVNYILYRILYYQAPAEIKKWNLCETYEISKEEQKIYDAMEDRFMHYVYRDQVLISDSQIIKSKYVINEQMMKKNAAESGIKVYYDYGEGLKESNTDYFFYGDSENIVVDIPLGDKVKGVRIDPMETCGIIKIKQIIGLADDGDYVPQMNINGYPIQPQYYLFDTKDPWIYIPQLDKNTKSIHVELSAERLSLEMVEECLKQHMGYKKLKLKEKLHIK